ncbi:MAG: hypothetical protein COA94_05420 [Rickettsiales bacterium]|nr:MAG: hypothetical protein COA94_05420 [Rickettsiales bacterium]
MNNNTNPFDQMKSFMNNDNLNQTMQNMPNIDFSAMTDMMKNNNDTATSSAQVATDGIQSILKKNSESLQKDTNDMCSSMKDAISAGDVSQITLCQQKFMKSAIDNHVKNTKDILDISAKSILDSMNLFHNVVNDNVNKVSAKAKK